MAVDISELVRADPITLEECFDVSKVDYTFRPGSPEGPFKVSKTKGEGTPQSILKLCRQRNHKYRHFDLAFGDMLVCQRSGLVGRVIERINRWDARIRVWTPGDVESKGKGVWVCFGSAFSISEDIPWWFPFRVVPVHDVSDPMDPENFEKVMDHAPGLRKWEKDKPLTGPWMQQGLQKTLSVTDAAAQERARHDARKLQKVFGSDKAQKMMEKLNEPLDSVGDFRVTVIGGDEDEEDE